MQDQDNELLLFDRLNVIKDTINKYGENNFYIAFSGGKDSTILSFLIDMALPSNKIPRIYINTGIEYIEMTKHVKAIADQDNRFIIVAPSKNIKEVLNKYGYPIKSKFHSQMLETYQRSGLTKCVRVYLGQELTSGGKKLLTSCPAALKEQFSSNFNLKASAKCCKVLKKDPAINWAKEHNKTINITGMRAEEGGGRKKLGCILTDKDGNIKRFNPLIKVNENFINWLIDKYNIKLCKLYYEPFNFKRTGCRACPYALNIEAELLELKRALPIEYKISLALWGDVYRAYADSNYRITNKEIKEDLKQ